MRLLSRKRARGMKGYVAACSTDGDGLKIRWIIKEFNWIETDL